MSTEPIDNGNDKNFTVPPMPDSLAPGQAIPTGQDLFRYIVGCLDKGCNHADVVKQLVWFGYPASSSETIVADVVKWRQRNTGPVINPNEPTSNRESKFNGLMLAGMIVVFIGIAVTVGSYLMSTGTYIIAWGAIVFGGIMVLRGAAQAGREIESEERKQPESQ